MPRAARSSCDSHEINVFVAAAAVVQITARRRQEFHRLENAVVVRVLLEMQRLRPRSAGCQFINQGDPARDVKIAQSARSIFQIRFQMKNGFAKLRMARVGDFGQAAGSACPTRAPPTAARPSRAVAQTDLSSPARKRQSSSEIVNSTLSWSKRPQSSIGARRWADAQSRVPKFLADANVPGPLARARRPSFSQRKSRSMSECGYSALRP